MTKKFLASLLAILALPLGALPAGAEQTMSPHKVMVIAEIENRREQSEEAALAVWKLAELGYQETRSAAMLQDILRRAGFEIDTGVAGIPTAFVASWGKGGPVIGILAEFDALPGISQAAVPRLEPRSGQANGHACGHNLLGAGSLSAAIAIRNWLQATATPGTIKLFGTPAEEGGAGKVYMVRAGMFDNVDAVLAWHPADRNNASPSSNLAVMSAKFRFHGVSAHAARAPEKGRSALDGVEAMTHMANMLREHMDEEARIHYVITSGGTAPNVVPNFAEVYFYARHPDVRELKKLFQRIVGTAEGAAKGTETRMEYEIIHGAYNLLPNDVLSRLALENFQQTGGITYTPLENSYARELYETLNAPEFGLGTQSVIQPYESEITKESSDLGDISWMVPLINVKVATWVPGTALHTWQAAATSGTSIGMQGMQLAAKILATTAIDLYTDPRHLELARAELRQRRGSAFTYAALVGDRSPPLDYRASASNKSRR